MRSDKNERCDNCLWAYEKAQYTPSAFYCRANWTMAANEEPSPVPPSHHCDEWRTKDSGNSAALLERIGSLEARKELLTQVADEARRLRSMQRMIAEPIVSEIWRGTPEKWRRLNIEEMRHQEVDLIERLDKALAAIGYGPTEWEKR